MQYKKMIGGQRRVKHWRERRNRIVCRLLDADRHLSREEALRLANAQMGRLKGGHGTGNPD